MIELLVVIAIIAVLAAILFPVFANAREKARETTCTSNMRQIGMAVRMYVQDYEETFPIFHAYNSNPGPGQPGHKGVEVALEPYIKSPQSFRCPDDQGTPWQREADVPTADNYVAAYGSSYRFGAKCYTVVFGATGSTSNNSPVESLGYYEEKVVNDADYVYPAETRIMRDEIFPWFGPSGDPDGSEFGYNSGSPSYYAQWHPRGGGMVFADGHAKFIVSEDAFKKVRATPDGKSYLDGCWWGCD